MQHASSHSLVATRVHSPLGARRRNACPPTIASAPPCPSGASPLTSWPAISCLRVSPVKANSPSPHVATSIVSFAINTFLSLLANDLPPPHVGSDIRVDSVKFLLG